MSTSTSNPRRRSPAVTPTAASGSGNVLTLKTNMVLRKSSTFHHSPTSPSSDSDAFIPPPLPRRSQTNLDDVVDAHRRRVALTLGNIDKKLSAAACATETSPSLHKSFRDDSLSVPQGILDHTVMTKQSDTERRVLRPRSNRRPSRYHESDSGLGTSIDTSSSHKRSANTSTKESNAVRATAVTRSAAASSTDRLPGLSPKATSRIYEHTLKPLLAKPSLKDFHPIVLACPQKIQQKEIVCLRDLEKTLLLIAPERTKVAKLYLEFCLTSIRCIQATVHFLNEREQTRPSDLPYSSGYFIDLVEQIHHYAQQLADAKEKRTTGDIDAMDVDGSDEIKLHGGITVNGRPAELVRVKKDGKAISIATGEAIELEDDARGGVRIKRSASQELEDEEEILRSMARRKKNALPEEYAPKKCSVPGCNKEFKRPCDLTKHEKTHSRPWKCPITSCKYHEYGWPTEKERDRHQNDKHASNPLMYECQYGGCQYKSKRESNCKQHMEKAHGWTYVRTKTNGKNRASNANSTTLLTPQLGNISTPASDPSIGTPPQDFFPGFSSMDFPSYPEYSPIELPQDIHLDYSAMETATPSTDASGMDHNSAYQDIGPDFAQYDDIYSANAQLPTPDHNPFGKDMTQSLMQYTALEDVTAQPAAPHFSPTGQSNLMLFTPASMDDMDEGFVDADDYGVKGGGDFILFPPTELRKQQPPSFDAELFDEIPSLAAGFSQPNSQNFPHMEWQPDYSGYSQ